MLRTARHDREFVDGFRMRGLEVTRVEGFSDAVFGFALTLLVVSLDVPKNFDDLVASMRGFPAFALCFLLLTLIWNYHYKFCRRYGLDDGTTRFLTCVLLFLVLFYVYPLKFLFNLSVNELIFGVRGNAIDLKVSQISALLIIYGLGFAAVYLAIFFLYLHAWRLRDALDLNELERMETRFLLLRMSIFVGVGILAALLACFPRTLSYSGFCYIAIFPLMRILKRMHRRKRAPLLSQAAAR
ncbi:MAG: DUF1211 domain-containing protein [Chthoniobacterales bacterium]|nr:DUF1211 domain-containing protein [Chthoniobacterales bacterium]